MTFARYITRLLLARLVMALLAITALLQIFDLFNNARQLMSRGGTAADLVTYASLRLPLTVEQALPIAMLIGTLATFLALTRSNEMIALRGAGVTMYRILMIGAPTAALVAVTQFVLIDRVTPWSERRFLDWWGSFDAQTNAANNDTALWLRSANAIVRVRSIADGGETLNDIEIIQLSERGMVARWINAQSAQRTVDGWMLHDAHTRIMDDGRIAVRHEERQRWPTFLDPASIAEMATPTDKLSTAHLRRILQGVSAGEHSPAYYQTRLYRSYAFPLAGALMLLLAAPAAYMIGRRGDTGRGLALGFSLGMGYLVTDGVLAALGGAGALPPLLAAWTPPVFFALIGGSVLLHYEE